MVRHAAALGAAAEHERLAAVVPRHEHVLTDSKTIAHLSANLTGVGSGALRDASLLGGLLIAAAGAGGLSAHGAPIVRVAADGSVSALLFVDPCHLSAHTVPERGLLLLDAFATTEAEAKKALEVFVRRLAPANVTSESRMRG